MQRRTLCTLLGASLLLAGTLHAQRGGGAFRGGMVPGGTGWGVGVPGHSPFSGQFRFHRFRNFSTAVVPFWYDDPYGYQPPAEFLAPTSPLVIVQQDKSQQARSAPPAKPQVIEIPSQASSVAATSVPAAIFILTSGQQLEARRYTLTGDSLYLTVDRQQRSVPISMLDVNATVAADRARGIDLRIPADRNEVFVGF
jgi:hypothetical protein